MLLRDREWREKKIVPVQWCRIHRWTFLIKRYAMRLPNVWMFVRCYCYRCYFSIADAAKLNAISLLLSLSLTQNANKSSELSVYLLPSQTGRVSQKQFPIICIYLNILQIVCPHASVFHFISFHSSINKKQIQIHRHSHQSIHTHTPGVLYKCTNRLLLNRNEHKSICH